MSYRIVILASFMLFALTSFAESAGQCVDRALYAYTDSNQLTFDDCHLSDTNLPALRKIVNFVNDHPTIQELWLWGGQIGDKGAKIFANVNVNTLYLNENKIGNDGAGALAKNPFIKNLELMNNQVGDEGAKQLSANTTLTALTLNNNHLSSAACGAFRINTTLQSLDLGHNELTKDCILQLSGNTTLRTLMLDYNPIGDDGAQALAAGGFQIDNISLWGTQLSDVGASAIAMMRAMRFLGIGNNPISDSGALQLTNLTLLEDLEIDGSNISDVSAGAFASLPNLKELHIAQTNITDAGAELISNNVTQFNQYGLRLVVGKSPLLTAQGIAILSANSKINLYEEPFSYIKKLSRRRFA